MSFNQHAVYIWEDDLTTVVQTVNDVIKYEGRLVYDGIGTGGFTIAAGNPALDDIYVGRIAQSNVWSTVTLLEAEVFFIVIKEINLRIEGQQAFFDVRGPMLTHELTYKIITSDTIHDGAKGPALDDIDQIMAYDPNWDVTFPNVGQNPTGTTNGGYIDLQGESIIEALGKAQQQSGEHWRITRLAPPVRRISWLNEPDYYQHNSTNITLKKSPAGDPLSIDNDPLVGKIISLKQTQKQEDIVTRLYVTGGGLGSGAWGLQDATITPDAGFSYVTSSDLVINTALELSHPQVERVVNFPSIAPQDTSTTAKQSASNALYRAAHAYLLARRGVNRHYTIKCITHSNPKPYQWVIVDFNMTIDGDYVIFLNEPLLIQDVAHEVGADGVRYTTLQCTAYDRTKLPTDGQEVMGSFQKTAETFRHADSPPASGGSPVNHDDLSGRDDPNNHLQYLLAAGVGRPLTGNLDVNAGVTIDGVDISAHAANASAHHAAATAGNGIVLSGQQISVDLTATSGLEFSGGDLQIADSIAGSGLTISSKVLAVNVGNGLEIVSDQVRVDLTATSGLEFSGGDLQIADSIAGSGLTISSKVLAVNVGNGLEIVSDQVRVDLTATSGLEFSGGDLQIADSIAGSGLTISSKVLAVDLRTDGGLEFVTDQLQVALSSTEGSILYYSDGLGVDGLGLAGDGLTWNNTNKWLEVDPNSDPGAAADVLGTDSNGAVTVRRLGVGNVGTAFAEDGSIEIGDGGARGNLLIQYKETDNSFHELIVRPTLTNQSAYMRVMPSGSGVGGVDSTFQAFFTDWISDPTNFESIEFAADNFNGWGIIRTNAGGTGTYNPLVLTAGPQSDDGLTILESGLVGFGTNSPAGARVTIRHTENEILRLQHSSAASSPYLSFYQDGTRKGYIQYSDSDSGIRVASDNGVISWHSQGFRRMRLNYGKLYINDVSNANMTIGLTINQGSADDEAFALKSSDVAHGMTDYAETDTYGVMKKHSPTQGTLRIEGYGESVQGLVLFGRATTEATNRNATGNAPVIMVAQKKSGSGVADVSGSGNLLCVRSGGTNKAIFGGDGDLYLDTALNQNHWDRFDDMAIVKGFRAAMSPDGHILRQRFGEFIKGAKHALESTGVARFNDDGSIFYGVRGLQMFTLDALRQKHEHDQVIIAHLADELQIVKDQMIELKNTVVRLESGTNHA